MRIKFIPFENSEDDNLIKPIPAIKKLPNWYKALRPFKSGDSNLKVFPDMTNNLTVKRCNPLGDALNSGYFILLENDVQVSQDNGGQNFVWLRGGDGFISQHSKEQISPDLVPEGYSEQPWKFLNYWGIETPPGYSSLFTHPINRTELPFLTLSGVVDTDDYNKPVNFPFFIRKDFEGIIEAGTPIAQVIPFKRESWKAEFEEFDEAKTEALNSKYSRKISRPYKFGYWKRKEYK